MYFFSYLAHESEMSSVVLQLFLMLEPHRAGRMSPLDNVKKIIQNLDFRIELSQVNTLRVTVVPFTHREKDGAPCLLQSIGHCSVPNRK